MEFRILGPLEVLEGAAPVTLGGGKQRALLAVLLLDANRVVPVERLIDELWPEEPPESTRKMVQIYVSQLRKALPPGRLRTRAPGYLIEVRDQELDLSRFERAVADGREALAQGDAERASALLGEALALWRGPALAEFPEPFARLESARLEESRLSALEERAEADLARGRHAELVGELGALVERHPLRERLRGQQMRALYGAGRQVEALAAYQELRRRLDEELGMEPSAALKELERRMLRQDPELGGAPAVAARSPVRRVPASLGEPGSPPPGAEIRYARSDDVRIAYQVVGEGPRDLVLVNGWVCTFEPGWENPKIAAFYRRLASMGRLILFDKRGTGLSDRVAGDRLPDLETRMDDVRAVMDAAGSERAVIVGISEGGSMSVLFAVSHPERTEALVLMGTFARVLEAPDYPVGIAEGEYLRRLAVLSEDDWARAATTEWLGRVAPDLVSDEDAVRWYVSYLQRGASPGAWEALRLMNRDIDIRGVLPTIGVPTLVLCRADEVFGERTRFMGQRIPGAKLVVLPGNDHLPWEGDRERLLAEVEDFLGEAGKGEADDRVLVTVLFADVVGSTAKASELGDRAWRDLLDRYHALVRSRLDRFRGRLVETSGDGVLAVFDGPARAVRCACAIARDVGPLGLEVRSGLHTGEVELADGGVRGIAVHLGARVAAEAAPGEVLVSHTVRDLVAGSGLEFDDRGVRPLKGIPGDWRLLAVRSAATEHA